MQTKAERDEMLLAEGIDPDRYDLYLARCKEEDEMLAAQQAEMHAEGQAGDPDLFEACGDCRQVVHILEDHDCPYNEGF